MQDEKPKGLRYLIEQGYVFPAIFPEKNDFLLNDLGREYRARLIGGSSLEVNTEERLKFLNLANLDSLAGYTLPIVSHDYGAKTPQMWNTLYERLGLKIRSIMLVADPINLGVIMETFRRDPKYLGGGFGVGFKEKGIVHLDRTVPDDLLSVNIVVREGEYLVGYNTDARGFVRGLEEKLQSLGKSLDKSSFLVLGAGGVSKEVSRLLAQRKTKLVIINRTLEKAKKLAEDLKQKYAIDSIGVGEEELAYYAAGIPEFPDAIINLTDKGSDGPLKQFSALAAADENNEQNSIYTARKLRNTNPEVIIADIVLPKSGKSRTLEIAEKEGLRNLVDGIPMVVNQAAPAYILVQNFNPEQHEVKVVEEEALKIFKEAAGFKD